MLRTKVALQRARILSHCSPCGGSSTKRVLGNVSQSQISQTLALVGVSCRIYLAVSLLSAFQLHTCFCLTVAQALKIVTADSPWVSMVLLSKFK
jgi:hypothetical protein